MEFKPSQSTETQHSVKQRNAGEQLGGGAVQQRRGSRAAQCAFGAGQARVWLEWGEVHRKQNWRPSEEEGVFQVV